MSLGTVKYNNVRISLIQNAISASFDTHEGAYSTTFENCRSIRISFRSGLQNISSSVGYQNRGFGTKYKNCTDRGSVVGFIEGVTYYEAGFLNVIKYSNCDSEEYQQAGFQQLLDAASNNVHIELEYCTSVGDGSTINASYYQSGFNMKAGITTLKNCKSARFNGAPFKFILSGGRFNIMDSFSYYFDCPAFSTGLRFDGAPLEFNLLGYKVRVNTSIGNDPNGLIRVAAGSVFINTDGIVCVNTSAPPPTASVTGVSITITRRSTAGIKPTNYNGDVSITVNPGYFK